MIRMRFGFKFRKGFIHEFGSLSSLSIGIKGIIRSCGSHHEHLMIQFVLFVGHDVNLF